MAQYQYSIDQLLHLRESPLVHPPENIPNVEQWIEPAQEQHKKQRTPVGSLGGKGDEGEDTLKRPSLLEHRTRSSYNGNNEDIFLGPRSSFSTRQHSRNLTEERAQEFRINTDRSSIRDRIPRERDAPRSRHDQLNGKRDDRPPRLRMNRDVNGEEETWPPKDSAPPSSGFDRSKFERSWLRKGDGIRDEEEPTSTRKTYGKDQRGPETPRDWGQVRSKTREIANEKPAWIKDTEVAEPEEPPMTQDDFKKWRDQMKAAKSGEAKPAPADAKVEDSQSHIVSKLVGKADLDHNGSGLPLFGMLGANHEELRNEANKPAPAKASAKGKSSRFASFFGPATSEVSQPQPRQPSPPQAAESREQEFAPPENASREDREGFARIMQQLRVGASASHGQIDSAFAPPDPDSHHHQRSNSQTQQGAQMDADVQHHRTRKNAPPSPPTGSAGRIVTDRREASPPHEAIPSSGYRDSLLHKATKSNAPDNNASFLLGLMNNEHQNRFKESQIYGQTYDRSRDASHVDMTNVMSARNRQAESQPQQDTLPHYPPPGFTDNHRNFDANQGRPPSMNLGRPVMPGTKASTDDFFAKSPPPSAEAPPQSPQEFFRQPPPPGSENRRFSGRGIPTPAMDQQPPNPANYPRGHANRPSGPSHSYDPMPPPPGLQNLGSRGVVNAGAPPGIFNFPPSTGHAPQGMRPPPGSGNVHMGPMPSNGPPGMHAPPGFAGPPAPPPGMPPGFPHQRRQPSGTYPPGFDVFAGGGPPSAGPGNPPGGMRGFPPGIGPRGMPPPHHPMHQGPPPPPAGPPSSYYQYLKQGAGNGGYPHGF